MELLQACGPTLYIALARQFSRYLAKCEVPVAWKQSSIILLFKKDGLMLTTRSPDDTSGMLQLLDEESATGTKGVPFENVNEYVYVGRLPNMENDIKPEIARRRTAG
ncbi:hypothetical protein ANCCEY_13552 [Ancylostoma ceylanicum]|uniref:Uncharacterized protein n=2 Tax=Ancylostoma ceylanicum TaxID=53326 RepID=A0A0D6LC09_9BILA|nr:hypothetical protein ANCCEY_13552 [Ancylostoma ceylanicum]EYC37799.1 hypothetical protein Y032_0765g2156 [Ancylostoma ceylanicum]